MSKTYETKSKILNILKQGAMTPTEISRLLTLSPSTISQHLKELKENGKIEEYNDEHFKNIKYFRRLERPSIFASSTTKFVGGFLALIIFAAIIIAFSGGVAAGSTTSSNTIGILLTDPPQVPLGTQSLTISYSSIKVLVSNSSGTFWDNINGTGTINLLSLVNFTKNLAAFKLPTNSLIKMMSIGISNATIKLNGTTYPVLLSKNNVSVKVFYANKNSTYNILFDMFPTVSEIVTGNQTIFVMSPAATAATVARHKSGVLSIILTPHGLERLNSDDQEVLNRSRALISITNASISTSGIGNDTRISVTVADNSNFSTELFAVSIFGNTSYSLNLNVSDKFIAHAAPQIPRSLHQYSDQMMQSDINISSIGAAHSNVSNMVAVAHDFINIRLNQSSIRALMKNVTSQSEGKYEISNILKSSGHGDIAANLTGNFVSTHIREDIIAAGYARLKLMDFHSINFFVSNTGALMLPHPIGILSAVNSDREMVMTSSMFSEYNLSADHVATLTYNGTLQFANGRLGVRLQPGKVYRIVVRGTNGATAAINVTAS